jgi:flagellar protein FlaF
VPPPLAKFAPGTVTGGRTPIHMSEPKMSYAAYATVQNAIETPRDLEIRAISHVTRQLTEANEPGAEAMTRIRALNSNVKLWSILVQDLSSPENGLPEKIKASYISLGMFAQRRSVAALTTSADLSTLIRLNTDILDALDHQRQASIAA